MYKDNIRQTERTAPSSGKSARHVSGRKRPMFTAKQFRAKAAESAESLKHTNVPSEIRELQRSRQSFTALAENEDWLANNFDKIIDSQGIPPQDDDAEKCTAH